MRRLFFLTLPFIFAEAVQAQENQTHDTPKTVVEQFMLALNAGDTTGLQALFTEDAKLFSINNNGSIAQVQEENTNDLIEMIHSPATVNWEERTSHWAVIEDGNYALVTMNYTFFYRGNTSHCGINVFECLKESSGWKIWNITDTRRTDCTE